MLNYSNPILNAGCGEKGKKKKKALSRPRNACENLGWFSELWSNGFLSCYPVDKDHLVLSRPQHNRPSLPLHPPTPTPTSGKSSRICFAWQHTPAFQHRPPGHRDKVATHSCGKIRNLLKRKNYLPGGFWELRSADCRAPLPKGGAFEPLGTLALTPSWSRGWDTVPRPALSNGTFHSPRPPSASANPAPLHRPEDVGSEKWGATFWCLRQDVSTKHWGLVFPFVSTHVIRETVAGTKEHQFPQQRLKNTLPGSHLLPAPRLWPCFKASVCQGSTRWTRGQKQWPQKPGKTDAASPAPGHDFWKACLSLGVRPAG